MTEGSCHEVWNWGSFDLQRMVDSSSRAASEAPELPSASGWYYTRAGRRYGPVEVDELWLLREEGVLDGSSKVWQAGMAGWQPMGVVQEQGLLHFDTARLRGQTRCMNCQRIGPRTGMVALGQRHLCLRCKPEFLLKVEEGVRLPRSMELAGIWMRFAALMIDLILLTVASLATAWIGPVLQFRADMMVATIVEIAVALFQMVFQIFYFTWFVGRFGGTPGKLMLGLRVVTAEGGSVGYWKAFWRYLASWISGWILYLGYVMAIFDPEKRTLHDHLCRTRVIRLPAGVRGVGQSPSTPPKPAPKETATTT